MTAYIPWGWRWGKNVKPQVSISIVRDSPVACGHESTALYQTALCPPFSCVPACHLLIPVTGLQGQRAYLGGGYAAEGEHADNQGPHIFWWAHSWPQPLVSALDSITLCKSVMPLPLHRHLLLIPTAGCVHTYGSGHHHCPLRSLLARSAAEDTNSSCSHCRCSEVLTQDHRVVNVGDPGGLSQRDIVPPQTQRCHVPPDIRPRVTAQSCMPPSRGESFPY